MLEASKFDCTSTGKDQLRNSLYADLSSRILPQTTATLTDHNYKPSIKVIAKLFYKGKIRFNLVMFKDFKKNLGTLWKTLVAVYFKILSATFRGEFFLKRIEKEASIHKFKNEYSPIKLSFLRLGLFI